jgi:carboxymethylenebutenolidase
VPPQGIQEAVIVTTEYVSIASDQSAMRTFIAAPNRSGEFPGILLYSDIFQLTGPTLRSAVRLAGYGFVVAAPEIYHRIEPPGTVIPFDDDGRDRGLADAARTSVAEFDVDCRAALDYLNQHEKVAPGTLAAAGFCIGGHLAFRAALQPDVRRTTCFYGTGIHNGRLGKDENAGSLERASEIRGELLMIFGALDPHVPEEGREKIRSALEHAGTKFKMSLYDAEHAFMRDEGPRYDPEATDQAWAEMIRFFRVP